MNIDRSSKIIIQNDIRKEYQLSVKNPIREDALFIDNKTKIKLIEEKFEEILYIIGLDIEDDSIKETPLRIAKMYVNEIFRGIDPKNRPKITLFKNKYQYHSPLIELDIPFTSFCEHHFVPIVGRANIAYIPKDFVIGLSKLHRLTSYYAKRPQVQERLTQQILHDLKEILQTENVGVVLKASHHCISCRGVQDIGSSTISTAFSGNIENDEQTKALLMKA